MSCEKIDMVFMLFLTSHKKNIISNNQIINLISPIISIKFVRINGLNKRGVNCLTKYFRKYDLRVKIYESITERSIRGANKPKLLKLFVEKQLVEISF